MTSGASVRFWQPTPEAAPDVMGAYFEGREGPAHLHEEWQFGVPEAPSSLSVGAFRRYRARVDDVTIVQPYQVHSEGGTVEAPPKWRMLYLTPAMVSRLCGGTVPGFPRPVVTDPAAAAELRELLRDSCAGAIAGSEFLRRVAHWLERFLLRHANDGTVAPQWMPTVERARVYIRNRPTQPVILTEVGAITGVTLPYLVRSFSRAVGLPPRSYHAQVRLARARLLLAEGKSATWVAYECGFADQSHLSRRFKECHGVTPGAFQAQYRAERGCLAEVQPSAA